jgi:hypothetical protein
MKSDLDNMKDTKVSLHDAVRFARLIAPENIRNAVSVLLEHQATGGFMMIGLISVGLFASPWDRKRAFQECATLMFLLCLFLPLLTWYAFTSRFVILFLPVLILWAAKGVAEVGHWGSSSCGRILPLAQCSRASRFLAVNIAIAVFLVVAWMTIGGFEDLRFGDPALKRAGLQLKKWFPNEKLVIMDMDPCIAFYAGGILRPFPYASERTALRYISASNVTVLVLRERYDTAIPYYRDWTLRGFSDPHASLLGTVPSGVYGRILLFRWHTSI